MLENPKPSVSDICGRHVGEAGALLPILHEVQRVHGCVSRDAVAEVARTLNLTRAEVDGVVSFYADFTASPRAPHVLKVCRAEACQATGSQAVWDAAVAAAAERDGAVEIEAVYCLGNCACGPSVLHAEQLLGRVDRERIASLIAGLDEEGEA